MPLQAGASQIDITPSLGIQLAGDIGRWRPVEEIRDPIYVKVLVVAGPDCKLVLVQLDLLAVTTLWTQKIRVAIGNELNIEPEAVMVFATQNHATPSLGDFFVFDESPYMPDELSWLRGGDDRYNPLVVERAIEAAIQANEALQPVTIGADSGIESRIAFNRRFVMRDGSARTHPALCDPHILHVEGPIDPEVGVVCLRATDGCVIAALLHYTCHPNHGYPERFVTADWPGAWSDGVRELLGEECIPLVLNGCCGNVHYFNHMDPDADPNDVDNFKRMGRLLTQATARIMSRMEYEESASIGMQSRIVELPWRQLPPELMQEVHELLSQQPTPAWTDEKHTLVEWDWIYAVSLFDLEKIMARDAAFPYEVQVFRIGKVAIVGLPGEPFVEAQLQIKLNSPTYPTYPVHMTNHYAGYIPTAAALERGGYETRPAHASKLGRESLGLIVEAATEVLNEVFSEGEAALRSLK